MGDSLVSHEPDLLDAHAVERGGESPPQKRRIRVAHVVNSLEIGGLEMVVVQLARLRDSARIECRVFCLGPAGELAPRVEAMGVNVVANAGSGRTLPLRVIRLARALRQFRPDVLHTHNPTPHLHGVLAARLAGSPRVVHTKHGRNYVNRWRALLVNRIASALSHKVVAVSDDAAQVARELENVPAAKLTVVRNGVDLAEFPVHLAARPSAGTRAITVARLNCIKDQETMFRAVRLVANLAPAIHLDVIGDGPERERLEALRISLGLEQQITIHGFRSDVQNCLAGADFFLLSSVSEGISLTLLEAMAIGLPVVATDVGGNPEVVVDGETGLLVPPKLPDLMANAILRLMHNPELLSKMSRAGRCRVEQFFDLKTVVRRYEQLYEELLQSANI